MALNLLNDATNLVSSALGQHVINTLNNSVNQLLIYNELDTLNVQDLHEIIVGDDDYQKQMEELQKKLAELEKEKERQKEEEARLQK